MWLGEAAKVRIRLARMHFETGDLALLLVLIGRRLCFGPTASHSCSHYRARQSIPPGTTPFREHPNYLRNYTIFCCSAQHRYGLYSSTLINHNEGIGEAESTISTICNTRRNGRALRARPRRREVIEMRYEIVARAYTITSSRTKSSSARVETPATAISMSASPSPSTSACIRPLAKRSSPATPLNAPAPM